MENWTSHYISVGRREKAWGLYVTGVGRARVNPNSAYPPVPHPAGYDFKWERGRVLEEFALLYLADGSGSFESSHQTTRNISAGDCVMLFPGEWHRYRPNECSGWEEYWVTFHGRIADAWQEKSFISPRHPLYSCGSEYLVLPLFEEMLQIVAMKSQRRPLECSALCHLLIARLLSVAAAPRKSESKENTLREAGDYLRTHPEKDVDLPRLAKRSGMSYSNFRREFTRDFGISPDRFHQAARVARLKQFLVETELPLKAIAERLGYSNEFYMMQVFKRHTGLTASQWRRRRGASPS